MCVCTYPALSCDQNETTKQGNKKIPLPLQNNVWFSVLGQYFQTSKCIYRIRVGVATD